MPRPRRYGNKSTESFRKTIVYKTLIIKYLLDHDTISMDDFRRLYSELDQRSTVRYFDRLYNAGYLRQCQGWHQVPKYELDNDRRDLCIKAVEYYRQNLEELQDEKDSNL